MKVSLNWLKQLADDVQLPVHESDLIDRIGSQLGQVDSVSDLRPLYEKAVIVKVVQCDNISGSDHLHSCLIDDGGVSKGIEREDGRHVRVVCGAPNVAQGQLVVWLPPGAMVPSSAGKEPFILESRKLMGVISNGMIASAKELAIGDDHDGIVVLPDDAGLKAGDSFMNYLALDDLIIDIENKMFTHRPDLFGQLGVARELAGIYGLKFTSPKWYDENRQIASGSSNIDLTIDNQLIDDGCPRFMAVAIDGLSVEPSPLWLQSYLARVGIRPINNLVDVTNYVMHVTGQPLHAYDLDKVKNDHSVEFVVRYADAGEELELLDGSRVKLLEKDIVVASRTKALGLGGIMGGADSEISQTTQSIVLECATFDMYAIRRSSMAHGIFSEAVTRFTKGQSALQNRAVLGYAIDLIKRLNPGASIISEVLDSLSEQIKPPAEVKTGLNLIETYLGSSRPVDEMAKMLTNVEFEVSSNEQYLKVIPPFWRTDILEPEDVIEEIARLIGFTNLSQQLPLRRIAPPEQPGLINLKQAIRRLLVSGGANELISYSFVDAKLMQASGQDTAQAFKLSNALSPQLEYYRTALVPSLLSRVHLNHKAGYEHIALFEIGKIHRLDCLDEDQLPLEPERLALVVSAVAKLAKSVYDGPAYYQARSYLDFMLGGLGIDPAVISYLPLENTLKNKQWQDSSKLYDSNRAAVVMAGDQMIGVIGEFAYAPKQALKLNEFSAGFELDLSQILRLRQTHQLTYAPLSKFPSVVQDMTVETSAAMTYQELSLKLHKQIEQLMPQDLDLKAKLIDIYRSDEAPDSIHWTFRLTATSIERTLTDQLVADLIDKLKNLLS